MALGCLRMMQVLAFTPHATSKIAGIEDLNHINTLGFRGEALASIAAVARITLITRLRGTSVSGIKVVVEGGKILKKSEIGTPEGTSVLVEDLFYNTPARKKFQKSKNTEIAHIHALLEGICLAHPEISFRLFFNRREQLVTDRTVLLLDTIARLYGSEVAKDLVPVHLSLPFMKISGYTIAPFACPKGYLTDDDSYQSTLCIFSNHHRGHKGWVWFITPKRPVPCCVPFPDD